MHTSIGIDGIVKRLHKPFIHEITIRSIYLLFINPQIASNRISLFLRKCVRILE